MKAYDFIYNEKKLSEFGMILCNFGGSKGVETVSDGCNITFNTISTQNGYKHESTSVQYEECLETTWQICKYTCNGGIQPITATEHRELTRWLNRKKFLKLKILDDDYYDLYCEASFNISKIEVDGILYGLELEVKTNRPFFLKEPKTIILKTKKLYTWEEYNKTDDGEKGESTGRYVTSYDREFYPDDGVKIYFVDSSGDSIESNYYYVYKEESNVASMFDESHEEGYIYPHTEITVLETPTDEKKSLTIHNALEDRDVYIAGCEAGEVITMDYPIIQSSLLSHKIQNNFNWNFFRVANTYENRRNDLTTSIPCIIKIEYSPIVKVGL